jgi:hypothetical protein
MKKYQAAEVHVLDRLMYLLEEQSVERLTEQDIGFNDFITHLYSELQHQSSKLRSPA